jgi:5-methylcytosine-specific restriction endonuclease McrA
MDSRTFAHFTDEALLRELTEVIAQERVTTATLLGLIAEVDTRRLYVPAGYSSMHAYCVEELHLSDDAAFRRIRAARAARMFPALLDAVSEGRLHLAAVSVLAPYLKPENVKGLIEEATHRRKSEVEELIARRFPMQEVPTWVRPVTVIRPVPVPQLVPGRVGGDGSAGASSCGDLLVPGRVEVSGAELAQPPKRFLLRVTIPECTHEKLRQAQALLSHALPSGDPAQVLDRALDALIAELEKRKLGATSGRPRKVRSSLRKRHIPARVRRAVWERDQGQCTFVGSSGHRCKTRKFLEFDHVNPAARGGAATVDGVRLRCRAHNQYEAERIFGAGFMAEKRRAARLSAVEARAEARETARARAEAREPGQALRAPS